MGENKDVSNDKLDEIEENDYASNGFYHQTDKKNYGIWYKKIEKDGSITEKQVTNFLIRNVTSSSSDTNKKDTKITHYTCEIHIYNDSQRITLDTNDFTRCRTVEKAVKAFSILVLDDKLYRLYLSSKILNKRIEKISDSILNEGIAIQFLRDLFEVFEINKSDFDFHEGNRFILNTRDWGQLFQDEKTENKDILQKRDNVYGATFNATDINFIGIKLDKVRQYMFNTGLDEYKKYRDKKICDSIKHGLDSLNLLKCSSGFTYEYTFNEEVDKPVKGRFTTIDYLKAKEIVEQEERNERDNGDDEEETKTNVEENNVNDSQPYEHDFQKSLSPEEIKEFRENIYQRNSKSKKNKYPKDKKFDKEFKKVIKKIKKLDKEI